MNESNTKIELITSTREDLFDISRRLAKAIEPQFLHDAANPVFVAVAGSMDSGKKIIADAMREELLGSTSLCTFKGVKGYDEYWTGNVQGKAVELTYIDAAWRSNYYIRELNRLPHERLEDLFLKQRKTGGISLIQNREMKEKTEKAGVDIWVENKYGQLVFSWPGRKAKESVLSEAFNTANEKRWQDTGYNPWVRYVEIEAVDPRLVASAVFQEALQELSAAAKEVADILARSKEGKLCLPERPYCNHKLRPLN